MVCTSCGMDLPYNARTCTECGKKLYSYTTQSTTEGEAHEERKRVATEMYERAKRLEEKGDYETAYDCYMSALAADGRNRNADQGAYRTHGHIAERIYCQTKANTGMIMGNLMLRKGCLVFLADNGGRMTYDIEEIRDVTTGMGRLIFSYGGGHNKATYACGLAKRMAEAIELAKEAKYYELRMKKTENENIFGR